MTLTRELHKSEMAYKQHRTEVLEKLQQIERMIADKMDTDEARSPRNWGHAGSMYHVSELLDDVVEFIGEEHD